MGSTTIAFANLRAEMARANPPVTIEDIAKHTGMTRETMSRKLSRVQVIKLNEAVKIKDEFFPDAELEYLFSEAREKGV